MPSNRLPSLLALRAFEAAARRLSFTEAARELHVSQAAISRHVRALEQDLGRPLFRRLHRRVELTVQGTRLASSLAAGFSQIHDAVQAVRGVAARRLRIAVEPAFAARWLVPRLGGFSAGYPDIELELEASDELRTLGRDTDIAIRFLSLAARRPRGRARKLFALDGFPVIARGRVGRGRRRADAEVMDHRLLHDDDGAAWRSWFSASGLGTYDQAKHLHFNDSSLALTAALRGQGVALSAPIYIGSDLKTGRLVRLGRTRVTFGDYWLLEATDRASATARAAFVGWLDTETKLLLSDGSQ
jgi:LysR family glycine cleavage system transcriptional activator